MNILVDFNCLWQNWKSHNLSSYGKVTLATWHQVKSRLCVAARWQLWYPDMCLPGEARWRCCCVNSPSCTFFIVQSTGLKLSCWFAHYEAVESVGSLCSGDAALLSYSWGFSFMLLAFCTAGAAVSGANESWHGDWLLHVQHGAMRKQGKRGLWGVCYALDSKCVFRHSMKMKLTLHFKILKQVATR